MSYKGRTVFQSDWAKYGGYGLAFAGALSKEGYLPGLSGTIGTAGPLLPIGGSAIALGLGAIAVFTMENIYDNKRDYIYYLENLNSSNYDKQDFEKEIEWNFDVKD